MSFVLLFTYTFLIEMGVSVSVTFLFTKYQSPSTKKTILYQRSLSRYYLIDNVLTWCVCAQLGYRPDYAM